MVVVDAVEEDENTSGASTKDRSPPPLVILNSKLEVSECHCDKRCDDDEDNEHNEEDAVDGVYLMPPDTGKYVVQLDVNSTEREEPCHCHLRNGASVPGQLRDFPWILGCAARSLEFCIAIFPSYSTQH